MKTLQLLFSLLFFFIVIISCENEQDKNDLSGNLIHQSECKSGQFAKTSDISDTLSCIQYSFNSENNILTLNHINAAFNCCPGDLGCEFTFKNDSIIIQESEEIPQCHCDCLYDLEMKIKGVGEKIYKVKIVEPYAGDQEKLVFEIDLQNITADTVCVTRKEYPWGMSVII